MVHTCGNAALLVLDYATPNAGAVVVNRPYNHAATQGLWYYDKANNIYFSH
jgi:hypothetical protein